jgi:hypothetical protein
VRQRWPLLLLLASGLTFLASLYLPWQQAAAGDRLGQSRTGTVLGLLDGGTGLDGWGAYGFDFGYAAGVLALALVAAAAVALVSPTPLPLARLGLLVGYAAAAVAVDTWYERRYVRHVVDAPVRFHLAYGAYLGIAAGIGAVLGALSLGRPRIPLWMPAALGLLVALALPWARFPPFDVSLPGFGGAGDAAVAVVFFAPAAVLLFCAGALVELAPTSDLAYGAWVGLGVAAVVSLLALRRPHRADVVLGTAAALFVTTLYFHWQAWIVGWNLLGAASALLALAIVFVPSLRLELAVAFALLVATQGFEMSAFSVHGYELRPAAKLGFASAALLFVATLLRSRPLRLALDRVPLRACAVLLSAVYVAVTLVPVWRVLPDDWATLIFIAPAWLGIGGVVLAVLLAGAWLRASIDGAIVVLIPLALLALDALYLIRARSYDLNWGGRIAVGASLLLALLGWLEQRGGLEHFRLPEILRIDRL